MPRVYITNRGAHDYSAAERFGRLVYCTEGRLAKFNVSQMYREIQACMEDSDPEDYILVTSLTTLNSIASAYFALKHGRLNLLLHQPKLGDKNGGVYLERVVVFDEFRGKRHEP